MFQTLEEFLEENGKKTSQRLPSGITIMDIAMKLKKNISCDDAHQTFLPKSLYSNTFLAILRCIPAADVVALQEGVKMFSQFYRYYADDPSLAVIPTSAKMLPNGAAIEMMAKFLSVRKQKGIDIVADACEVMNVNKCLNVTYFSISG